MTAFRSSSFGFFRRKKDSEKEDLSDPLVRESRFRALLLRILTSALFFASVTLLTTLLPFYPIGLAVILALIAAIMGYAFPPVGFLASVIICVPPLAYQTGMPFWWLAILIVLTIAFAIQILLDPPSVFAPVAGMIAATITMTPAHFLMIPLIIAVGLFRQKEKLIGPLAVVIMFTVFFIPIHQAEFSSITQASLGEKLQSMRAEEVYNAMNAFTIPIFHQLSLTLRSAPQSFDLPALSAAFGSAFVSSKFFHPYLFLMIDRLIILFFPVLIAVTLSISLVVERFWYWLRDRSSVIAPLMRFSAVLTIFVGTMIFLLPLVSLSPALRYYTAVNSTPSESVQMAVNIAQSEAISGSNAIAALLASAGAVGAVVAIVAEWSTRRNFAANIASLISVKSRELSNALSDLASYIIDVSESGEGVSITEEIAEVERAGEEVKVTQKNIDTLRPSFMKERLSRFNKISGDLPRIKVSVNRKLGDYYMEKVAKYNTIVAQLSTFGFHDLKKLPEPSAEQISGMGDDLLKSQQTLKALHLELAKRVFETARNLVATINIEFESIDATSVEISKKFLDDKKGEVALDYLINTLSQLDARYGKIVEKVVGKEDSIAKRIIDIYLTQMLPMFETLGKDEASSNSYEVIVKLKETLSRSGPVGIAYLTHAMNRFQIIQDGLKTISLELMSHMAELEALNDARAPGFNWGKDTTLAIELESAIKALQTRGKLGLDERITNAESSLKNIEEAAKTVSQYMIMSELILLSPLFDRIIVTKLRSSGAVKPDEIPAAQKYAKQLLRLYASRHSDSAFDIMVNRLQLKKQAKD